MRKVIVEVFVPAASQTFDIFLPVHLPLYELITMVGKAVGDISEGLFQSDESTVICGRADGMVLNTGMTAAELDIKNGAQLMLI